ncbi:MAG: hydrolase [Clostridia bacterium]|nr:hydrolase [Clostridia bacterium]
MNIELLIEHNKKLYSPITQDGIVWSTDRKGSPGQLTFKVVKDDVLDFTEGDAVRLRIDEHDVFYGFVFTKKRNKEQIIDVTAYDQLRYFKNKDTYVYENKTAGELIQMIANDYHLQTGVIEDTGFKIPSRVEENTALFDMAQNTLDLTLMERGKMFVLYDDFGKITLKDIENMKVDVLIDEGSAENLDYTSSIDSNTYNKVKLTYDNEKTKTREVYIAQHGENINQWGLLQFFEKLNEGENGQEKANALLSLYNKKTRNLSIKNAFGDIRVRAGCLVPVILNLGDMILQSYMLVEKCKHEIKGGMHMMDLTLRGAGEFIA